MTEYDNRNKGVMFQPYPDQRLVLQGKLDIEGNEARVYGIRQPLTEGGEPVIVLVEQIGILYPNKPKNDETLHEKAPAYSGPLDRHASLRIAGWKGEKNGNHYLQLKVSEKQGGGGGGASNGNGASHPHGPNSADPWDGGDDIPF